VPHFVSVALPVHLFSTFTYTVDEASVSRATPGARALVPVRNRRAIGVVVDQSTAVDPARQYRAVSALPDDVPAIPPALLRTCHWLAEYYAAPLGMVLRSALPALLTGEREPVPAPRTRRVAVIARSLDTLIERDALFARARKQRQGYELLESLAGRAAVEHLERQLGISRAVLNGLEKRGLIRYEREVLHRDAFAARPIPRGARLEPTLAQREAIEQIAAGTPGAVFLLHGVTGSGKTLVYIEVLRRVLRESNRSAIVLVPEIALTPQTVDRFRAAFGEQVAVLHSSLSDGERLDAWRAIRAGRKPIVVGARSAIFAPLERVGVIIVDEEHETSYKQNEIPRYHARDVAIVRAREEGAIAVLGSATPSLESWTNADQRRYTLLTLPERAGGAVLPRVEILDLRRPSEAPRADPFRRVICERLEVALAACLERSEQVILLLNRRGYAAFVQCVSCGDVAVCPHCSISLTAHRAPERLVCHYCAHEEPPRAACHRCRQQTTRERGLGTQQVERLLAERFPSVRIARMDVDTTSGKWAHAHILDRVARGDVDILLGTQMIAKGLDFPNVTLVGVVDADVGMNLPDFRAAERCFQLLAQVSGRAGRGPKGGSVFIQTRLPDHHAVRCAVNHDYRRFVAQEIADRFSPPYPPAVRIANIVFSGRHERQTSDLAQRGAEWLAQLLQRKGGLGISIVGPAPCPVERVKSRWRWHVLLKAKRASQLTRVVRYFAARFPVPQRGGLRAVVDRDPLNLL
jgi:primosomal protein N' (replication factor Y)